MCSFIAIAQPLNHRINVYNILAVSFFCQLLFDPFQIMSVGFQLSYLAAAGIITLQPSLYHLWEPKHKFWDQVWKLSTVSVAAQLATFPLGMYYFHQFPNYFLLSNLFVIPGAFAIVTLGLVTLATSFAMPLAHGVGWLLTALIRLLNGIVFTVEQLPFSHLQDVYLTPLQCYLLIALVGSVILCFRTRKIVYVIPLTLVSVVFSASLWVRFSRAIAAPTLTVYQVPGHTAVDFIRYGQAYFLADSTLLANQDAINFDILPNRQIHGVQRVLRCDSIRRQFQGCAMLVWEGKTILQIESENFALPAKLTVDMIVISNNSVTSLAHLLEKAATKEILLDSSNSLDGATRLLHESEILQVETFSVPHQGAFTITG